MKTKVQNLWDIAKAVLAGKLLARESERSYKNQNDLKLISVQLKVLQKQEEAQLKNSA